MNRRLFRSLYVILYLSTVSKVTSRESYGLLQLNGTKIQTIWMRYLLAIHQHCTTRSSKLDLRSFEDQQKNCLHNVLLRALTCNKDEEAGVSCIASRQRVKHYCEYTPPGSVGGLHRETVKTEIQEVTREMSRSMGLECLDVHYITHRIYNSNFCYLTRGPTSSTLDTKLIEQIIFQFNLNKMLGLNITFTTFLLSDMCVMAHPYTFNCFWHKGTEYVSPDQLETTYTDKLYFCMKRPQWSVYTGHVVAISYSVCTVCVHHVSRVVFMYQVLDSGFFRTVKDEFRKVYYTVVTSMSSYIAPLASICIKPVNDTCSVSRIQYYYLRGEKYEQINVWKNRHGTYRVIVQSFSDSARQKELAPFKKFKVPAFHCIIQVYENSVINSDASLVDIVQFQFHPIKVKYNQLNDEEAMVTMRVSNCKDTDNCQRVLKFNSSYVRISVMTMVFSGWKVHSCLYGASVSMRKTVRKRTTLNEHIRRFTISVTMLQISRRR